MENVNSAITTIPGAAKGETIARDADAPGRMRRPFAIGALIVLAGFLFVTTAVMHSPVFNVTALAIMAVAAMALHDLIAAGAGLPKPAVPERTGDDLIPEATREVLESIDEPLLLLDMSSRIVFASTGTQSLIRGDAVGKRLSSVLRTPELLESIDRVTQGGAAETVRFTMPVPVERHFEAWVTRTLSPLVLVRIRDVSEIRRSEQLRADFVANASHELRTPLASLTGFIDTLRGHAKDDPAARDRFLEIMSTEASRMRRLIDDLLSLNRIELNEHIPPAGEVDVVMVVRDAADVLKPLADSEGMRIDIQSHEELRAIGERDQLTQVFQNLMHNAIKYGRTGGEIRVRFGHSGEGAGRNGHEQIFVAIEDEGEGIPREAIPRLTERFYRVDVKRSRERGGTGLGLAIVKHILNRHRGRLEINSVPGRGSTFTTWLPAAG